MNGLLTIMQKEWAELRAGLFTPVNLYGGTISLAAVMAICGIFFPFQQGIEWVGSTTMVFCTIFFIPFSVVAITVCNTFTQERQQHTLEPLLASPVSEISILLGKILMPTFYGWGSTCTCMLAGMAAANLSVIQTGLVLLSLREGIALIALSLLFSFFVAAAGALASMRANNALEAQAKLLSVLFLPSLSVAFLLGPLAPAAWKGSFLVFISMITVPNPVVFFIVLLLLVDASLLLVGIKTFNRKSLLLLK
jgi:ABC-type Na+ efflux pump permease subunit